MKISKYNHSVIISFLILFICPSCYQDIIDLDISTIDRQIVIVGKIIEGNSSNYISLNRVGSLSDADNFPPVNEAEVTISDDLGNTEFLYEVTPGRYKSDSIIGEAGRVYTLQINVDAQEYYAVSQMPEPIEPDSIFVYKTSQYHNSHYLSLSFTDKEYKRDYLMIRIFVNNIHNDIYFYNDEYSNGEQITLDDNNFKSKFYPGDNIRVVVATLDETTYRYYTLLFDEDEIEDDDDEDDLSDLISSPEFNPINNFTNNALGYFSAQAIRTYFLNVQY
ncbi:hypothetical protein ACFLTH_01150 [Bacteroidota bacterium]